MEGNCGEERAKLLWTEVQSPKMSADLERPSERVAKQALSAREDLSAGLSVQSSHLTHAILNARTHLERHVENREGSTP